MANDSVFQRLSVTEVQSNLLQLLREVACNTGRVEIIGDDSDCDCVLISKKELASLERALDLLGDSDEVRVLSDRIARYTAVVDHRPAEQPLHS